MCKGNFHISQLVCSYLNKFYYIFSIDVVSDDPLDEVVSCIKVRLSTTEQEETELSVRAGDTIAIAKIKLAQKISTASRQRWFYGGQLLEDRLRIRDLNIPGGHIVQVVFSDLPNLHSKEKQ